MSNHIFIECCMWCSDSKHCPDESPTLRTGSRCISLIYVCCSECSATDEYNTATKYERTDAELFCIEYKIDNDLWISDALPDDDVIHIIKHKHHDGSVHKVREAASISTFITF